MADVSRAVGQDVAAAGLQWHHLTVGYGRKAVLHAGDSTPLRPGSLTILLGPNGGGKSTLLRTIAGLQPALAGHALWNGQRMRGLAARAPWPRLAYMPQALPAAVALSVLEAVQVAWRLACPAEGRTAGRARIGVLLEELNLADLAEQPLQHLSGGQRQLVGLAQALVRQPRVLLLDEPLAALDLRYQAVVMQHLQRLTRERELVTLLASHDLNLALQVADTVLVVAQGRLCAHGPPQTVITPALLAQVYGVQARLEADSAGQWLVRVDRALG